MGRTAPLAGKAIHVPGLGWDTILELQASTLTGPLLVKIPTPVHRGIGKSAFRKQFDVTPSSLCKVVASRRGTNICIAS